MINPQHILPTFARLKFFYAKSPFLSDFYPFLQLRRVTNEDVGGAVEWRQMKLKISCGVPLLLNHLNTTSTQLLSMVYDRSLLPRSSRLQIKNISKKCSRDDRKMMLGGLHGHGVVHSSGVGPPMVPRGHVIHHQQRCRAQQRVTTTITQLS